MYEIIVMCIYEYTLQRTSTSRSILATLVSITIISSIRKMRKLKFKDKRFAQNNNLDDSTYGNLTQNIILFLLELTVP